MIDGINQSPAQTYFYQKDIIGAGCSPVNVPSVSCKSIWSRPARTKAEGQVPAIRYHE